MKREIGISVYPDHSDPKKIAEYIKKAAELGYTRIFMSMLEVKDEEKVSQKFSEIIGYAKDKGFEVILDIAPVIFDKLGISYDDLSFLPN